MKKMLFALLVSILASCASISVNDAELAKNCKVSGIRFCFTELDITLSKRPTGMHFIIYDGKYKEAEIGIYESYAPSFHEGKSFRLVEFSRSFGNTHADVEARISEVSSQAIIQSKDSKSFPVTIHIWADAPQLLDPKVQGNLYSSLLLFEETLKTIK